MILCLKLIAFGEVIVQFYHEECEVLKFVRWETTFMAKHQLLLIIDTKWIANSLASQFSVRTAMCWSCLKASKTPSVCFKRCRRFSFESANKPDEYF